MAAQHWPRRIAMIAGLCFALSFAWWLYDWSTDHRSPVDSASEPRSTIRERSRLERYEEHDVGTGRRADPESSREAHERGARTPGTPIDGQDETKESAKPPPEPELPPVGGIGPEPEFEPDSESGEKPFFSGYQGWPL